jgi:hypothetical protein
MSNVQLGSTPLIGKINQIGTILAAVGAAGLAGVYVISGSERFFADYLLGFWYFGGISVTMLFFSALQYLGRAGWSASIRRIAENFAGLVPVMLVLMLPIIANVYMDHHSIYEWAHGNELTEDEILVKKAAYFTQGMFKFDFFVIRLVMYCLLWFVMHRFIIGNSLKQDSLKGDISPTRANWKRSAPFVLLYAVTITFAAFDLLMTLEPHWFSTIWGVYAFAGHFVSALSIITLMAVALHSGGHLKGFIRDEHFHDLGKLMFAFSVFWTYIAFSQYFIIWYANLPEETIYFTNRMTHGWEYFGYALILTHFVVPFMVLLRQDVKRKKKVLVAAAIIILLSHFIDLTWIIMPAVGHHILKAESVTFGWQELTGWIFFAGLFLVFAARQFKANNAVAVNDPLLHESFEYHA